MKLSLIIFGIAFCLVVTGCMEAKGPNKSDLLHRNFEIISVDGKIFSDTMSRKPNLEFNEGFRISGGICNRFTAQAELKDSVLFARQMASTKMFCPDPELNTLESTFATMLMEGATITLDGNTLTLRQSGHTLVYTLRDRK